MVESLSAKIDEVVKAAQLASLLEVAGTPKPGNVHRTADFTDTRFEHFLAGSIVLGRSLRLAAKKGIMIAEKKEKPSDIGIGELIYKTVYDTLNCHNGGNTHLGISLLFIPIAVAAGEIFARQKPILPLNMF